MKKYIAILLCLSMLLIGLVACKNKNDTEEPTDTVDTTETTENNESEEEEEEEDDGIDAPNFDDYEDTEGKIQINGDNIGTPGGSNAGENWTNPY